MDCPLYVNGYQMMGVFGSFPRKGIFYLDGYLRFSYYIIVDTLLFVKE